MICGSCRIWAVAAGAFLAVSMLAAAPGYAQSWPQRPVKLILTLGPGSGTDIGMRLLADRLPKVWNQPVVVENRPGGDGIVAITSFLSANDDHVLLGAPVSSFTAHPYVVPNLPYRQSDLAPIARGWNLTLVVAVPKAMPVNSMKELVELIRKQPGKLNWAGTTGAIDFLFAGWLKQNDLEMARVPYRNPQDAANDLATGRIEVVDASLPTLRPQLQAGAIKLLAVTNAARDPALPDLPTVEGGRLSGADARRIDRPVRSAEHAGRVARAHRRRREGRRQRSSRRRTAGADRPDARISAAPPNSVPTSTRNARQSRPPPRRSASSRCSDGSGEFTG